MEDGPAGVVQLNRFPFFNEHLTCFHMVECPFQGNGIWYNAINTLKAWNHSALVQFHRGRKVCVSVCFWAELCLCRAAYLKQECGSYTVGFIIYASADCGGVCSAIPLWNCWEHCIFGKLSPGLWCNKFRSKHADPAFLPYIYNQSLHIKSSKHHTQLPAAHTKRWDVSHVAQMGQYEVIRLASLFIFNW